MLSSKPNHYRVGKDWLYFMYRQVILPWELEWSTARFHIDQGSLREFCDAEAFSVKAFPSAAELKHAMSEIEQESRAKRGLLWFVRRDQKPKDTLRHLRNAFAHGLFTARQKNRQNCVDIVAINQGTLKARGFIPLGSLRGFVDAARSCKC